jgi:hypothetical protein
MAEKKNEQDTTTPDEEFVPGPLDSPEADDSDEDFEDFEDVDDEEDEDEDDDAAAEPDVDDL